MVNYRLGWIVIFAMSGALGGCGDSLHDIIDELKPPGDHQPPSEPPIDVPGDPVDPGDPGDPDVPPAAADAGAAEAPPTAAADAGPIGPSEPPPIACPPPNPPPPTEPPPTEPPPVEPPPMQPPPTVDAGPTEPPPMQEPPPMEEPPPAQPSADAGAPPVEPPPAEPPPPSFEANVWPIFQTGCSPCHTTLGLGGHLVGSADLATAFADATRLGPTLIARLDGGGMPLGCAGAPGTPGCIAVNDLATIQLWIDTGEAP
jgi:hypothetical protein